MTTLNFNNTNFWQNQDALMQRFLNSTRRQFITYAVAQTVDRISPVAKVLLDRADSKPFQPAWIIQPVIPDATQYPAPQYLTGDQFDIVNYTPNIVNAQYEASLMAQTVRVSLTEMAVMESPNAVIDQVAIKVADASLSVMREISTRLATHDESATVNEKFQGMQDIVDNGAFCNNLGNIDRTANTWWNSFVFNADDYGAGTIPEYQVVQRVIADYLRLTKGAYGMPHVGFAPFGVWQKLAESFQAIEQYVVGNISDVAETREYETKGIIVNGIPIFPVAELPLDDPLAKKGRIYFLNLDHIKFTFAEPFNFWLSEWKDEYINGRLSFMAVLLVGGNLWTDLPRAHFYITNMPSV